MTFILFIFEIWPQFAYKKADMATLLPLIQADMATLRLGCPGPARTHDTQTNKQTNTARVEFGLRFLVKEHPCTRRTFLFNIQVSAKLCF